MPVLLDLFCGAGGCSVGYSRAGFDVVGVDLHAQPNYPFEFEKRDALEALACLIAGGPVCGLRLRDIDAIHASPPCQAYSTATPRNRRRRHKVHSDLVAPTRALLDECGLPWVIENVPAAPLRGFGAMLCGSMFGLDVRRHRLFETSWWFMHGLRCNHEVQTPRFRSLDSRRAGKLACVVGVHGSLNYRGEGELRKRAMGIDWMTQKELSQAIPPAYTEFVGRQLLSHLEGG